MELAIIHASLSEPMRLRILTLLLRRPLCVCHFQALLAEPQVRISKHLSYLRKHRLVTARKSGAWVIYALPEKRSAVLVAQLAALERCADVVPELKRDLRRLARASLVCVPGLGETGCAC